MKKLFSWIWNKGLILIVLVSFVVVGVMALGDYFGWWSINLP